MSTETPERPKNIYQLRNEAIARAITKWQESPDEGTDNPISDASALDDALRDEELLLVPRSTGHGKWRVLVDGQPAPHPDSGRETGTLEAEEAAEVFLTQTAEDYYNQRQILVRPASEREMVVSAVTGNAAVYEEPVRITAETYSMSREKATGRVELEIGGSGRRVVIDLGDDGDEILAGLLGFHERDPEDTFFDEDDDTPGGAS